MAYLIHYNKNHSKANGQFVSGDGDGDGIIDDHHNYARNKKRGVATSTASKGHATSTTSKGKSGLTKKQKIAIGVGVGVGVAAAAGTAAILISKYKNKPLALTSGSPALTGGQKYAENLRNSFYTDVTSGAAPRLDARYSKDTGNMSWIKNDFKRAAAAKVVGGDW
jgi:hypothetical protein